MLCISKLKVLLIEIHFSTSKSPYHLPIFFCLCCILSFINHRKSYFTICILLINLRLISGVWQNTYNVNLYPPTLSLYKPWRDIFNEERFPTFQGLFVSKNSLLRVLDWIPQKQTLSQGFTGRWFIEDRQENLQEKAGSKVWKEEPRRGVIPGKVSRLLLKALGSMTCTSKIFPLGSGGRGIG